MDKPKTNYKLISLILGVVVVVAVAVILVVFRSSSKSSPSLSAAQQTSAKNQIQTNWQTFFANSTPLSERENLLQNGSQFTQPIKTEFNSLGTASVSLKITNLSLVSPTKYNLLYSVYLDKQPVLVEQSGQSVLINNTWKVSDETLCQLLKLAGQKPSVCQNF
jgi:cytoskeletal protein RodZ